MTKNWFEVVLQESTFPIDIFLLMGDNYVGNDALGRQCHAKRKTLEANLAAAGLGDLKRQLYRALVLPFVNPRNHVAHQVPLISFDVAQDERDFPSARGELVEPFERRDVTRFFATRY